MLPRCLDCGEGYGDSLFLWIDDELWEQIGCKPEDFLCAHCTIDRLEKIRSYAYLVAGVGEHKIYHNTKVILEQNGTREDATPVYPLGTMKKILKKQ
jgi:hypothetical protein